MESKPYGIRSRVARLRKSYVCDSDTFSRRRPLSPLLLLLGSKRRRRRRRRRRCCRRRRRRCCRRRSSEMALSVLVGPAALLRPFPRSAALPLFKPSVLNLRPSRPSASLPPPKALSLSDLGGAPAAILDLVRASPPTWQSAALSNLLIFLAGSPLLLSGLSASGLAAAFPLGVLTWRAFGPPGFLIVAAYFVVGTAATKLKMKQKEVQGVAEKRQGRRGPGSIIGSSAAGCVCAFLSIYGVGGEASARLWRLGFIASFCTKLSDTVSSEMGKAYGKTTYLVTTFKVVPRGTEGAVSIEGTIAGFLASALLSSVAYFMREVDLPQAAVCVLASQIANLGESLIGAALQEKEGYRWLNNDAVNVINISIGSILAVLMQQLLESWHH